MPAGELASCFPVVWWWGQGQNPGLWEAPHHGWDEGVMAGRHGAGELLAGMGAHLSP